MTLEVKRLGAKTCKGKWFALIQDTEATKKDAWEQTPRILPTLSGALGWLCGSILRGFMQICLAVINFLKFKL